MRKDRLIQQFYFSKQFMLLERIVKKLTSNNTDTFQFQSDKNLNKNENKNAKRLTVNRNDMRQLDVNQNPALYWKNKKTHDLKLFSNLVDPIEAFTRNLSIKTNHKLGIIQTCAYV